MKPRVLILTAGFGEGHNAAARALAAAIDRKEPGAACVVDLFAESCPRLNAVVRRGYLAAINGTPRLWSRAYRLMDKPGFMARGAKLLRREFRLLAERVALERPSAICCTFPAYAFLLSKLAKEGRMDTPYFNIVTDSISINSVWWSAGCDGWFLPNEDSAAVLRNAGVDQDRLHVSGFPVTDFFSRHAGDLRPPDLAAGAAPRVLYIVNSGTRNAEATAHLLLAEEGWEITCTVGRNRCLRESLAAKAAGRPREATILGWTDQIPRLLMTHHVVVSKAGGATTQEAIAARCPMIVNQVVPGQEEGNYELLRRHGIGMRAETPEAVVGALRKAFAHQGRVWSEWSLALDPLARPDAADAIAAHVFAHAARPGAAQPEPVPAALS